MYRESQRKCPSCALPMDEIDLKLADGSSSAVDVCRQCRWVFIEFFDGEAVAVARELREILAGVDPTTVPDSPIKCPDCQIEAVLVPFEGSGPLLWRCGDCAGLLATPATLRALASFEPPRPTIPDGLVSRVMQMLGRPTE